MGNSPEKRGKLNILEADDTLLNCRRPSLHTAATHLKSHTDIYNPIETINIAKYDYPFENLIFEGGGIKALAYIGALRIFEEIGLTVSSKKIKRVAGTSAGSYTALFLALGYNSSEIEHFLAVELPENLLDKQWGWLTYLPNIVRSFGWNRGIKVYEWLGRKVAEKTGDPDTTFMKLYESKGVEFCAVVVNINQMCVEYCHPKTTPDMPVRLAVKMSLAVPIVFIPVPFGQFGTTDLFVDGGMLCNYPIHAFDGWWLSMKPEDGFFRRISSFTEMSEIMDKNRRFGEFNAKTLGLCLYAEDEEDPFRSHIQNRIGTEFNLDDLPNTKLARKYRAKAKLEEDSVEIYQSTVSAIDAIFNAFSRHDVNSDERISLDEFKSVMEDESALSAEHKNVLFDSGSSIEEIFYEMSQYDTEITFSDLRFYLERRGLKVQNMMMGHRRKNVDSVRSFLINLQETLMVNASKLYIEHRDVKRTIGINTGYIGTNDLDLNKEDIKFLIDRGVKSTLAYLKYFVLWNGLEPKS